MLLFVHFLDFTELLLEVAFLVVPRIVVFLFFDLLLLLFALFGFIFDLTCKAGIESIELTNDAGHHQIVTECHRKEVTGQVEGVVECSDLRENVNQIKPGSRVFYVGGGLTEYVLEHHARAIIRQLKVRLGLLRLEELESSSR